MLGFDSALSAWGWDWFGHGTGDIILDNVRCNGDEASIEDCGHNGYLTHNCMGHFQDAGVTCNPNNIETTTMMMNNGGQRVSYPVYHSICSIIYLL